MAGLDESAPDRRASWVALRTLRQRPSVVGRTEGGDTIYEIRSVRAVLPAGAAHFHRLVPCAKCGSDQRGPALVTPADLDHPPNPMFCDRCVRTPQPEAAPPPRVQVPGPPKQPAPVAPPGGPERARVLDTVAPGRLAELEGRVSAIQARLETSAAVEAGFRLHSSRVEGMLVDHEDMLAKLSAAVTEAQAAVSDMSASNEELGRLQDELNQRVVELGQGVVAPTSTAILDALREPLRELAQAQEGAAARLSVLERSLQAGDAQAAALRGSTEAVRSRVEAIEDQLGALVTAMEEVRAQVRQLPVSELAERLAAVEATVAEAGRRRLAPQAPARSAPDLVEGLERQLLEAEDRLARHDGLPPPASGGCPHHPADVGGAPAAH